MKDLAFHLSDLTENSVRAGATEVEIGLRLDRRQLVLRIADNGCGMDAKTLRRALDPFYTTRTTRRVGLGLPFLVQNAEQSGGWAEVRSEPGRGTRVEARFGLDHIDCPPAGDLASTFMQLVIGYPAVNLRIRLGCGDRAEEITSVELREALGDLPAGHPQAAVAIRELFRGVLGQLFGDALG